MQLKPDDFKDYQAVSETLCFQSIPFTKVKYLILNADQPFHVQYKTSFGDTDFVEVNTRRQKTRKSPVQHTQLPAVTKLRKRLVMSKEKKVDISSMLKYMPPQDVEFYQKTILK